MEVKLLKKGTVSRKNEYLPLQLSQDDRNMTFHKNKMSFDLTVMLFARRLNGIYRIHQKIR